MHTTTQRKRPLSDGFTLTTQQLQPGNLFPIAMQIQCAAISDKKKTRRKMKEGNRTRNKRAWQQGD